MQRLLEPELMDDAAQVVAYANADFEAAHSTIVGHFQRVFPHIGTLHTVLDLGCGPADIAIRFARMYPNSKIDAVDGSQAMLKQAQHEIECESLENQIAVHLCRLPNCKLPSKRYDAIVSNSLLHHLHEPQHLWSSVRQFATTETAIFICDLFRPASKEIANELVQQYAGNEPDILRRDFYNSLLAAFTPDEVHDQLSVANLHALHVEQISDRHMLIHGYLHKEYL